MKKIENIVEEVVEVIFNLKNGKKKVVPSKTIYTYYDDGTNDCKIEIAQPLELRGNQEEVI